jgi:hypothetical protein
VRELKVPTPGGEKANRFVDVAGRNPKTGQIDEMHQVGKQTQAGNPVAREQRALNDIRCAVGNSCSVEFHPYN